MIVQWLLIACLCWGTFAFGAVYPWSWVPLLAAAAFAGVAAWVTAESRRPPVNLMLVLSAVPMTIALQLIPMSQATLRTISPGTDAILRRLDFAYANAEVSHPISVAPRLTAIGLTFAVVAFLLTLGVSRWLTRTRMRHLAGTITAVGGIMAVGAVMQRAASPALIYGFWKPYYGTDPFGPFVNKNHFAGWVLMGLPMAMGFAVGQAVRINWRHYDWRSAARIVEHRGGEVLMSVFAAFAMTLALLLSLSRSGIASAAVSIVAALVITSRTTRGYLRAGAVVVVLALIGIALMAADRERLSYRFASVGEVTYASRLVMWSDTWRMASAVPATGVGVRAYTVASLVFQSGLPDEHVGAAHNDWLQLLAEGGLLVGVPTLILLVLLVREVRRRFVEHRDADDFGTTYWIRTGAVTGLFAIGLQSFVEFSLQMPGNTILFALLWAIALAPAPARPHAIR